MDKPFTKAIHLTDGNKLIFFLFCELTGAVYSMN